MKSPDNSRVEHTQPIRPLALTDARDLLVLRLANREFMAPLDPVRPDEFFTLEAQTEIARNPERLRFAILDEGELATGAVGAVVEHAFGPLGLHRVEAGTLVDNVASQRVLEKNGFERIGLARNYLHIGGAWRDHLLFQRTADHY